MGKAKGVIREIVPWERAREYFFWRVRRRLMQDALVSALKEADSTLSHTDCLTMLGGWIEGKVSWEDDKAVLGFFEAEGAMIDDKLGEVRKESVKSTIASLLASLPAGDKDAILKAL